MSNEFRLTVTTNDKDIAEARRIRLEVFTDEQGIPAHLDDDGSDSAAFHVLCRSGDLVIGTGRLVKTNDREGVLGRIAVTRTYRGLGLGARIVRRLETVASQQQLRSLSLQPHKHLEAFYRRLGYETVPGIEFVGAHELLMMRKDLI